jgi:DNA invertase Pin-like site-specific DNA recombinase
MKRAVLYTRVSTCDQNPATQALDLRRLAEQRGFEIIHEYTDRISGAKAKRPALDQMLTAAHRREIARGSFLTNKWSVPTEIEKCREIA